MHPALTIPEETARAELESVLSQFAEARLEPDRVNDELQRQTNEHEAALAAMRSQLAEEPLARPEGLPAVVGEKARPADAVDDRMAEFRKHLQDVHQHELEERQKKRLSTRLSRLWGHTGPAGPPPRRGE